MDDHAWERSKRRQCELVYLTNGSALSRAHECRAVSFAAGCGGIA